MALAEVIRADYRYTRVIPDHALSLGRVSVRGTATAEVLSATAEVLSSASSERERLDTEELARPPIERFSRAVHMRLDVAVVLTIVGSILVVAGLVAESFDLSLLAALFLTGGLFGFWMWVVAADAERRARTA